MKKGAQRLRFGGSLILAITLLSTGPGALAQQGEADAGEATPHVTDAVQRREEANRELVESQERVDELSDETDLLLTRYQVALRQIESLDTYNHQLEELVSL